MLINTDIGEQKENNKDCQEQLTSPLEELFKAFILIVLNMKLISFSSSRRGRIDNIFYPLRSGR